MSFHRGKSVLFAVALIPVILLGGCSSGDRFTDLEAFVEEVNKKPKGAIKPLPQFRPYEPFKYSASGLRAPFTKPVEVKIAKRLQSGNKNIKPDNNRPKEYLEGFSLGSLKMVGTLANDSGLWALVNDSQGGIYRITNGNYAGRNHGKVVATTETHIDLIEIVPDGQGAWIERPQRLELAD